MCLSSYRKVVVQNRPKTLPRGLALLVMEFGVFGGEHAVFFPEVAGEVFGVVESDLVSDF